VEIEEGYTFWRRKLTEYREQYSVITLSCEKCGGPMHPMEEVDSYIYYCPSCPKHEKDEKDP